MIKIHSWVSHIADEINTEETNKKYEITFTYINKFDDRSDWVQEHIKKLSNRIVSVSYCPLDVTLSINNITYPIRSLENYVLPKGKILIDSTSLALPELLHLFRILNESKRPFDVIYAQPTNYAESKITGLDKIKTFNLSDDGLGIQQVPPYIGYSDNSVIFFFLGWEGHRFGALIHSDEFNSSNLTCLIGTPPFKLGWENRTLSNNYKQLADINNSSNSRFKFAGANDPLTTYETITNCYKSANYEKKNLCLAPFGTKPAAIAAAQFAVNNSHIVMLYDFVQKKNKRSSGTDIVHIWSFQHSETI